MPPLSSFIAVQARYSRAVHLFLDSKSPQALDGFVFTPLVSSALEHFLTGLLAQCHSFTLFGPYGSGKSTFALFLYQLFQRGITAFPQDQYAVQSLVQRHAELGDLLARPWLCVAITARPQAIGLLLLEGLLEALRSYTTQERERERERELRKL